MGGVGLMRWEWLTGKLLRKEGNGWRFAPRHDQSKKQMNALLPPQEGAVT